MSLTRRFAALAGAAVLAALAPAVAQAGVFERNGNFFISYTDYARGDATLTRTYNTRTGSSGIFGNGWSSELEHTLYPMSNGDMEFQHNGGGQRVRFRRSVADGTPTWTDGHGNSIVQDGEGYMVHWKSDGERNRFDPDGRLVLIEDLEGERARLTYRHGVVETVVLEGLDRLEFAFYANGKVARIAGPAGEMAYHYGFDGALIRARNVADGVYAHDYDPEGRMTAIRYADGSARLMSYDGDGRLVEDASPNGCRDRLAYGRADEDPKAHYWTFRLTDCNGRVERRHVAEWDYRGGDGHVMRYWFVPPDMQAADLADGTRRPIQVRETLYDRRGLPISRQVRQAPMPPFPVGD